MKLKLKENPKEWRKAVWLSGLGLALLSSALRWRRLLPVSGWTVALAVVAVVMLCAWLRPSWFRGYYRFSSRLGYLISQLLAAVVLALLFVLVVTPLGLVLRLLGKDFLHLKTRRDAPTCWHPANESTPLDRLF